VQAVNRDPLRPHGGVSSQDIERCPPGASRLSALLAALASILFTLVYLPGLHSFFSNDDWALVYYYGQVRPERFWEYFSPAVIWFYRPLQAAQFGLLYHLFGLNELPFNLSLMAMHLVVCWLGFLLLRGVTLRPALAAGAIALFAASWIYVDILIWKANFNTAQWAILTLAACVTFARFLDTGSNSWRLYTYGFCILNLFTKESAVSTPLLLLLVWLCMEARAQDLQPSRWAATVRRLTFLLGPAVVIVLVYVGLHHVLIKDIYTLQKADYVFVGPGQALRQCLVAFNHTLLSFHSDPVLLPAAPWLRAGIALLVTDRLAVPVNLAAVPLFLAILTWKRRDRVLAFGIGWLILSFVPMLFLSTFHASRFYYMPALGGALILARLFEIAWAGADRMRAGARSTTHIALAGFVVYFLVANVASTLNIVLADRDASTKSRAVYDLLLTQRGHLPSGCLVVLRNAPQTFFKEGLGAPEMARLALHDRTVDAVVDGQPMENARVIELHAKPEVYLVDLNRSPLKLERVSATPRK